MSHRSEYMKEYANKNRKRLNAYKLDWYYKTNQKERQKQWYYADIERNRDIRRINNIRRRRETLESLGGRCCRCGFEDIRALQIDHINGGGGKDRKGFGHSASALKRRVAESIRDKTNEYQLLCANCNWIKREENRELFGHRIQ